MWRHGHETKPTASGSFTVVNDLGNAQTSNTRTRHRARQRIDAYMSSIHAIIKHFHLQTDHHLWKGWTPLLNGSDQHPKLGNNLFSDRYPICMLNPKIWILSRATQGRFKTQNPFFHSSPPIPSPFMLSLLFRQNENQAWLFFLVFLKLHLLVASFLDLVFSYKWLENEEVNGMFKCLLGFPNDIVLFSITSMAFCNA